MEEEFKWLEGKYHQKGGPGSGHHGHAGVPGKVGGSAAGSGTSAQGRAADSETSGEGLSSVGDDPNVKKYFEKGPSKIREIDWARHVTFTSDRGRGESQDMTIYKGKGTHGGEYKVRIFGGPTHATWASTGWHKSAGDAIKESLSSKHHAIEFLKTVSELPEFRKRPPSGISWVQD